jgi:hypothetical protein
MSIIWSKQGLYERAPYKKEEELEAAIERVQTELFGRERIYLPVKKLIGAKTKKRNIPDGYLIDLSGKQPRLYVVENELAAHDPLRHIAVQILEFSLAFESDGRSVKSILFNAIQKNSDTLKKCEKYAESHEFRNLDHFLEYLVFDSQFAALVIIDELPDDLEAILAKKFQFGVEVIELARYRNNKGEFIFRFSPFLADVIHDLPPVETTEVDTVVVPARIDGAKETFLGENMWYAVRIHGSMKPQIKHIALYQVAPVSAITHIADVSSIEPWKDSGKSVVNFTGPAKKIKPIKLVKGGRVKALQNLRYTTLNRLKKAKKLDDVW